MAWFARRLSIPVRVALVVSFVVVATGVSPRTAAGSPGVHLIDFYPGIYQGPEGGQQLYRLPQLTYADDHPGNRIPALRFAFEVTRGASSAR